MEETGSILHTGLPVCNKNRSKNPYGSQVAARAQETAFPRTPGFRARMTAQDPARRGVQGRLQ